MIIDRDCERCAAPRHTHEAVPFDVCYLSVPTGTERDTMQNVEYAAYEYNVYVQCDYHGEKIDTEEQGRKRQPNWIT